MPNQQPPAGYLTGVEDQFVAAMRNRDADDAVRLVQQVAADGYPDLAEDLMRRASRMDGTRLIEEQ